MTQNDVNRWFKHHIPTPRQITSMDRIRKAGAVLATAIFEEVPNCGDQSAAIRQVRIAVMTASAGLVSAKAPAPGSAVALQTT